ncbi:hypothetical protein [Diaphorobacter aerolatus]|uniref:Uncharacterized protein n=1 Tax=Diaphorobacter aerolatus TaxID=1288495 RepID=A0A7H0GMH3_9BURK|nr:hypothetical protein [Diaphorobacter aerolatus]QNP49489.1 hypothetical protein H9K75_05650 [Diaphorobacter aerolatus]
MDNYVESSNAAFENLLKIVNSDDFMRGLTGSFENIEVTTDIDMAVYWSTDQDAQDDQTGILYWTELLEYNTSIYHTTEVKNSLPDQGFL